MSDNKPTEGPWESMPRGRVVQKITGSTVAECLWQADADYITALANGHAVKNPYAADNEKLGSELSRLRATHATVVADLQREQDAHRQTAELLAMSLADVKSAEMKVTAGIVAVQERERIIGALRSDIERQARYGVGGVPTVQVAENVTAVTIDVAETPRKKDGKNR